MPWHVESWFSPSSSPSPIKGEGTISFFYLFFSLAPWWERVRVRGDTYFHCHLVLLKHHEDLSFLIEKNNNKIERLIRL